MARLRIRGPAGQDLPLSSRGFSVLASYPHHTSTHARTHTSDRPQDPVSWQGCPSLLWLLRPRPILGPSTPLTPPSGGVKLIWGGPPSLAAGGGWRWVTDRWWWHCSLWKSDTALNKGDDQALLHWQVPWFPREEGRCRGLPGTLGLLGGFLSTPPTHTHIPSAHRAPPLTQPLSPQ